MKARTWVLLLFACSIWSLWAPSGLRAEDPPPPQDVSCFEMYKYASSDSTWVWVHLSWTNPVTYETIRIVRMEEGQEPVDHEVSGNSTFYLDKYPLEVADPLSTRYEIRGVSSSGGESAPVEFGVSEGPRSTFIRGDVNRDGTVSISDSATLSNFLFKGDSPPSCFEACDVNDDDKINISDEIDILRALFLGGPIFPEPFPLPAQDIRPGSHSCAEPAGAPPQLDERFVIEVAEVEGEPGTVVDVPVLATTPVETDGVSVTVQCDPTLVRISGYSIEGTVLGDSAPVGGFNGGWQTMDPEGKYAVGVLMHIAKDIRIPPLDRQLIMNLQVEILAGAPETTTEIVPVSGIGYPAVNNEFSILGEAVYASTYPKLVGGLLRIAVPDNLDFFVRSDVNADGTRNIADPIYLLNSLFAGGPRLPCVDAGDANDDGLLDISDAVSILGYLFLGTPAAIPEPFGACGMDPTPDGLGCLTPHTCD